MDTATTLSSKYINTYLATEVMNGTHRGDISGGYYKFYGYSENFEDVDWNPLENIEHAFMCLRTWVNGSKTRSYIFRGGLPSGKVKIELADSNEFAGVREGASESESEAICIALARVTGLLRT
jgi:hypothetical protein